VSREVACGKIIRDRREKRKEVSSPRQKESKVYLRKVSAEGHNLGGREGFEKKTNIGRQATKPRPASRWLQIQWDKGVKEV